MIFQKYDDYIDSKIDWLGKIPSQWSIKRNKSIFQETSNISKTGKETLLTVSHITGVTPRSEKNVNMFFAETMEGYKLCNKGDLLINTMWAWMGALGTSNYDGICSPAYNVYKNRNFVVYNHKYFDYLFRTSNFIVEMTRVSKGITTSRLRLYPKDFYQIELVLPSIKTQNKIVDFLDKKTQKIDSEINLLEQKIEKYKELKQTLIKEIVLKGLDKGVELKDSNIVEIGFIPSHWSLIRIKDEVKSVNGGAFKNDISTKGLPIIKIKQLVSNIKAVEFCNPNSKKINKYNLLKSGDLLFSWSTLLYPFIYKGEKAVLNQHIFKLVCSRNIDKYFLYYKIIASLDRLNIFAHGSTMKHILKSDFDNLELSLPRKEEQTQIANYLDEKTKKIDTIIETIEKKIEVLKEFRKTLINDVVKGKVKVE